MPLRITMSSCRGFVVAKAYLITSPDLARYKGEQYLSFKINDLHAQQKQTVQIRISLHYGTRLTVIYFADFVSY